MTVTRTGAVYNTAPVNNQAGLEAALADTAKTNIVLTGNITLNGWNPAGANITGRNFYGNGHTITIQGLTAAANMGLFGVVDGGAVRDLTVVYDATPAAEYQTVDIDGPASAACFGGIAGRAQGGAQFINVLVKGAATYTVDGDNDASVGGMIGQMTGTASVLNGYGGLNLTVLKAHTGTATGSLYVGGVAGSMGETATTGGSAVKVEEVSVVGNITVGRTTAVNAAETDYRAIGGLYVGGVTGFMNGKANAEASRAILRDCDYKQGIISVTSGTGSVRLGGVVGAFYQYATITDCSGAATDFEISKTGTGTGFYAGGFIGQAFHYGTIQNCYTEGPMVINNTRTDTTGEITAGGFAGLAGNNSSTNMKITYCYTVNGNVSVLGNNHIHAGGFLGLFQNATIQYCYTTGNVNVISRGSGRVNAGGFSAYNDVVNDCYSTGDVFVSNSGTGQTSAGGFTGYVTNTTVRCFATGNVTVERISSGTTYTGSFGGYVGSYVISNSAALAASLTVIGAPNTNIGRFFGATSTNLQNNHAFIGMKVYHSATYPSGNPADISATFASPTAHNTKNGRDATLTDFRRRTFWTNPAPAAADTTFVPADHGLGFSATNWIFTTVESKGHPILRASENGAAMPGQS
jgi:hypothetical protein